MADNSSYVTSHRLHKEGFTEEFLDEALANVQHQIFGDWPLYGEKSAYGDHDAKSTQYIFGQIFGRDGLDLKTRGLMVLACLCILQREGVMRIWINACLNLGWSEAEIKEMGMLLAHVGGFPTSRGSVLVFDDVFEKRKAQPGAKWAGA
ncbi:carboxymuconolactone decarboxylase family protein [Paraburkholderia xenovorans]|jgi:4-carboxymuconolactone decarboxylase